MEKRKIVVNKSGIVNAGWKKFAVYFIGVPSKGDVYYIGKSKNLSKRTGYTDDVENYKCINQNSGRFPLVLWNNDTVVNYLLSTPRADLANKTNFLDIVEDGGIQLFETYKKGNKIRKNLKWEDICLGAAIIVFTRKYNILESIRMSLCIYRSVIIGCSLIYTTISDKDNKETRAIKEEFNTLQKVFFNSLSKGEFIVQQGLDRSIFSIKESGTLASINNIDIIFGDWSDYFKHLSTVEHRVINSCRDLSLIEIITEAPINKYIIYLIKPWEHELDFTVDIDKIKDICSEIEKCAGEDIMKLIYNQLNFVPIE